MSPAPPSAAKTKDKYKYLGGGVAADGPTVPFGAMGSQGGMRSRPSDIVRRDCSDEAMRWTGSKGCYIMCLVYGSRVEFEPDILTPHPLSTPKEGISASTFSL